MSPRGIITVLWCTLVWVALWGDLSAANVLAGLGIGLVSIWLVPLGGPSSAVTLRPLPLLRFLGYFLWALVRSSAVVAWEIVTPGDRTHQGIIELRLDTTNLGVATLIANAISLTPGTLTLEVREDPLRLYVHVLHLREMDVVRAELDHLHRLVVAALPPRRPDPEPAA